MYIHYLDQCWRNERPMFLLCTCREGIPSFIATAAEAGTWAHSLFLLVNQAHCVRKQQKKCKLKIITRNYYVPHACNGVPKLTEYVHNLIFKMLSLLRTIPTQCCVQHTNPDYYTAILCSCSGCDYNYVYWVSTISCWLFFSNSGRRMYSSNSIINLTPVCHHLAIYTHHMLLLLLFCNNKLAHFKAVTKLAAGPLWSWEAVPVSKWVKARVANCPAFFLGFLSSTQQFSVNVYKTQQNKFLTATMKDQDKKY